MSEEKPFDVAAVLRALNVTAEEWASINPVDQAKLVADISSGVPVEHAAESKGGVSLADFVIGAASALVAEPLCHAGWDSVVTGEHMDRGIPAIIVGLLVFGAGGSFHWWKGRLPENGRDWARRNSGWMLFAGIVLFFLYALGPNIYERATRPVTPPRVAMWAAPNFEGKPLGWDWEDINLGIGMNPNGDNSRISIFTISGKNLGTEEVDLQEAHLISGIDGTTVSMKVNVAQTGTPVWIDLSEIAPVPPGAEINLSAQYGEKQGGIPEADFLRNWGTFSVVIQANGQKIRHDFTRDFIRALIERFHPERAPHVSKKKS